MRERRRYPREGGSALLQRAVDRVEKNRESAPPDGERAGGTRCNLAGGLFHTPTGCRCAALAILMLDPTGKAQQAEHAAANKRLSVPPVYALWSKCRNPLGLFHTPHSDAEKIPPPPYQ